MQWKDVVKQIELVSVDSTAQLIDSNILKIQTRVFPDPDEVLDDPLYIIYCNAAEKLIESICGITLRKKTLKLTIDTFAQFDCYALIRYEVPPVISITDVKYYDEDDTLQTLNSSLYETWLAQSPPMLLIKSENIPDLSSERTKRIESTFIAGNTGTIPPIAQLLILELVAFWWQNREAFGKLPSPQDGACWQSTATLLDSLRWRIY